MFSLFVALMPYFEADSTVSHFDVTIAEACVSPLGFDESSFVVACFLLLGVAIPSMNLGVAVVISLIIRDSTLFDTS